MEQKDSLPVSKAAALSPLETLRKKYYPGGPARFLERINNEYPFQGKIILEVGGHNVLRELALEQFGARKWFSCDFISGASGQGDMSLTPELLSELVIPIEMAHTARNILDRDYVILDGDITKLKMFSDFADICISINTFEHILDMPGTLETIKRVLVPGGLLISSWGPMWSGKYGHHLNSVKDHVNNIRYDMTGILPFNDWDHLLLSPIEMYKNLLMRCSTDSAREIVRQIYTSERINRFSIDDHIDLLAVCGMEVIKLEKSWKSEPDPETLLKLRTKYQRLTDFTSNSLYVVVRKYSS